MFFIRSLFSIILLIILPIKAISQSLYNDYQLPPLTKMPSSLPLFTQLQNSQAMQKMQLLDMSFALIEDPYSYSAHLQNSITENLRPLQKNKLITHTFTGKTTEELNTFLATLPPDSVVLVQSLALDFNTTIILPSRTVLYGFPTTINGTTKDTIFSAENIKSFVIANFNMYQAGTAIYLRNVENFWLHNLNLENNQRGIILQGESIWGQLEKLNIKSSVYSGLTILGKVEKILINDNIISDGQDYFNWSAGLVITDTPLLDKLTDETHYREKAVKTPIIDATMTAPRSLAVIHNQFLRNRASGLYMDGGVANVIQHNIFEQNDKEGLCLDGGSLLNVVMNNTLIKNGFRRNQTKTDLTNDFVIAHGVLVDNSSVAKLPAVSLDNAIYNILIENTLRHNAGDGIKIVRTGFRNIFMFNTIHSNNKGHNSKFHFFGILLGNAPTDNVHDIGLYDFLPSIENIIAANLIYGKHYSGILLDKDAAYNDIYNNTIFKFMNQAIEIYPQTYFNSIIDNAMPKL